MCVCVLVQGLLASAQTAQAAAAAAASAVRLADPPLHAPRCHLALSPRVPASAREPMGAPACVCALRLAWKCTSAPSRAACGPAAVCVPAPLPRVGWSLQCRAEATAAKAAAAEALERVQVRGGPIGSDNRFCLL